MNTAIAERPLVVPAVSEDQVALITRTVAVGATPDELKIYLYDCARQGVHPLDRLIHFTKRKGKYTPITSIDFMRTRAADTGEYAGSNDAEFTGKPGDPEFAATVIVTRLVQGNFATFGATARWSEYKPSENDFMWQKMPHTMLAKCAEALALRKGFPRQLAGLYAKEEMDQAGEPSGYTVTAPPESRSPDGDGHRSVRSVPPLGEIGTPSTERVPPAAVGAAAARTTNAPAGSEPADSHLRIMSVNRRKTSNKNVTKYIVVLSDGREVSTIREQLATLAEQLCQDGDAVEVQTYSNQYGENLDSLKRASKLPEIQLRGDVDDHSEPVAADEIPFVWIAALVAPLLGVILS